MQAIKSPSVYHSVEKKGITREAIKKINSGNSSISGYSLFEGKKLLETHIVTETKGNKNNKKIKEEYNWFDNEGAADEYTGDFTKKETGFFTKIEELTINGRGEYKWKNKDSYRGNFKDGSIDGKGIYRWSNGDYYEGRFSNGEIEVGENGTLVLKDGTKYIGTFKRDENNNIAMDKGRLELVVPGGYNENSIVEIYEGEFENNRFKKGSVSIRVPVNAENGVYEGEAKTDDRGHLLMLDGTLNCKLKYCDKRIGSDYYFKGTFRKISEYDDFCHSDLYNGQGNIIYTTYSSYGAVGAWKGEREHSYSGEFLNGKPNNCVYRCYCHENNYLVEGNIINGQLLPQMKCTYGNKDVYEGVFRDDKKNGPGKMKYATSGDTYEGLWSNDNMVDGKWKITNKYGDIYEGGLKGGKKCGMGKMTYANGDIYEGDFKDDKKCGQGKIIYKNGSIVEYMGNFKNDVIDGKGVIKYLDNSVYNGECEDGKKSGEGKMEYSNGDVWEGHWSNENFKSGTIVCKNGDKYKGYFNNNGKLEGNGTIECDNGCVAYEGNFRNGKKSGPGKMSCIKKDQKEDPRSPYIIIYKGNFVDDKKCGEGTMEYANVELSPVTGKYMIGPTFYKYEGNFENDLENGTGKFDDLDLYRHYEGEFKNGKAEGKGILNDKKNKTVFKGIFKNGSLNGPGEIVYRNDDKYVGEVKNNKPDGKGKFTYSYDRYSTYDGGFKEGMKHGEGAIRGIGMTYTGNWKNDKKHGKGILAEEFRERKVYRGEWNEDQFWNGICTIGNERPTPKDSATEKSRSLINSLVEETYEDGKIVSTRRFNKAEVRYPKSIQEESPFHGVKGEVSSLTINSPAREESPTGSAETSSRASESTSDEDSVIDGVQTPSTSGNDSSRNRASLIARGPQTLKNKIKNEKKELGTFK
jgi:hypothetical protein